MCNKRLLTYLSNGFNVCGPPQVAGHANTQQFECCHSIDRIYEAYVCVCVCMCKKV